MPANTKRAVSRHRLISPLLTWAGLFFATLLAYLPAISGSKLWDDDAHITRPEMQSLHGLWRIWFDLAATQQYYPLLHSAFWIEHRLWGDAFTGYHLVNVLLHSLCAFLLTRVMRKLELPGGMLAGAIFALHPVCVEAVAWMSEQKSTLSGFFCLAALLAYLDFDRSRDRRKYLLSTLLFILALMSKSVTATLCGAILVILWWRKGKLSLRADILPLAPWFVIGAAAGLFTAYVERHYIGAQGSDFGLSLAQRVLIAGRVVCFYFGKLVWPVDLIFSYPRWKVDPSLWWQWGFPVAVLAVAALLIRAARSARGPLAGFLIFVLTLFPVLGFLDIYPFRFSFVADHFQYLACLGIIAPLSAALARYRPKVLVAATALVAVVLGSATYLQARNYVDAVTLYTSILDRNPNSVMAHHNLSVEWFSTSRQAEALDHLREAVRLDPDSAYEHKSLGISLTRVRGHEAEAVAEFTKVLQMTPNDAEVHTSLGDAYSHSPDGLENAVREYREAIRIRPDYPLAHNNLGFALDRLQRDPAEVIAEYKIAIRLDPTLVSAHTNLGNLLLKAGRAAEAASEYRSAIHLLPQAGLLHYRLGMALTALGQSAEAASEFHEAERLGQPTGR